MKIATFAKPRNVLGMKERTRNIVAPILYVGREVKALDDSIVERVFGHGGGNAAWHVRVDVLKMHGAHVLFSQHRVIKNE